MIRPNLAYPTGSKDADSASFDFDDRKRSDGKTQRSQV